MAVVVSGSGRADTKRDGSVAMPHSHTDVIGTELTRDVGLLVLAAGLIEGVKRMLNLAMIQLGKLAEEDAGTA